MKPKKLLSLLLSLALALSLIPTAAFAAETQTYQPGTYKAKADVKNSEDNDDEWENYAFDVSVTVDEQGKISAVDCATDAVPSESASYVKKAVSGTKKATGVPEQIVAGNGTEGVDAVSGATYTSDAIIAAVKEALGSAAPAAVDKTGLQAKVDEAKALTEADYTAESWAALQTALKNAQDVLDKTDATQDEVDAQLTALTAAVDALVKAAAPDPDPEPTGEYTYLYAALDWAAYWANEGVTAAGSTASSGDQDSRGESDKGAFDVVSRATANHGLHRGSFQCSAVIYAADGTSYAVSHWSADGKTIYLTDGTSVGWNRGTITKADGSSVKMDHYEVTGVKYVPVKVKTDDVEAFKAKYATVSNGGRLVGGYGENKLTAYDLIAAVDENTNGLREAVKNDDGSFTFGQAQTGTSSGIQGEALKTAAGYEVNLREGDAVGSFGETIRVDLNGDYGELGSRMQSVVWTYYGDDSTYTNAQATYGTKFAADNWMHKSMGIQLGLTDSLRTGGSVADKTGYWTVTIHALGYADTVIQLNVTDQNIARHELASEEDKAELQALVDANKDRSQGVNNDKTWSSFQTELAESQEMLTGGKTLYKAAVKEQITHLTEAVDNLDYVLMNIPYADFYAAEVKNDIDVDTVSSATKNKTRTGTLVGGSYHVNSDGTDITGITYAVKVTDASMLDGMTQVTDDSKVSIEVTNRGKTTTTEYNGKDALFESASYSYYVLSEKPASYKELTKGADGAFVFGAVQGESTKLTDASAELSTTSRYGDYQIDVEGIPETVSTVYAVVLNTQEGAGYGLRHLENVWRVSELAFCTGFTTEVHGSPTSSDHYKAIMGQTIDRITYYTDQGIYTIDTKLYVPIKTGVTAKVADGKSGSGKVEIELSAALPADFNAEYSVEGIDVAEKNGELFYDNAKPGQYTLTITDQSGKYAPISAAFVLSTDEAAARFNGDDAAPALTPADGVSEEEFAAYLKGISSVTVNGTKYAASGRGAVTIVKADGAIDLTAAANGAVIFGQPGAYELKIAATGYPELTFTLTVADPDQGNDNKGDNGNTGDNSNSANNGNNGNSGSTGGTANNGNTGNTGNNTSTGGSANTGADDNTGSITKTSGTNDSNGTQKTDKVPGGVVRTADESHVFFFAGLLLLSGAAFTLILLKKRETR